MRGPNVCQLWTLERIREEKCAEEGDCWLFLGAMSGPKKETPTMWWRGKITPAYVVTWLTVHWLDAVPPGISLWRKCRDKRCINPKHILSGSRQKKKAWLTQQGAYTCSPTRKARITATARRDYTKLKGGMEEARQIRASADSEKVLAERHGISVSRVNRIRNGKAWSETVLPSASIFNMGGA